jgi:hypothetical protein
MSGNSGSGAQSEDEDDSERERKKRNGPKDVHGQTSEGVFSRIFRHLLFEKNPPNGAESSFIPDRQEKILFPHRSGAGPSVDDFASASLT